MKKTVCAVAYAILLTGLLSGCSLSQTSGQVSPQRAPEPQAALPDYQTAPCDKIWQLNDKVASRNPLFWLRAIDCAQPLSPTEARTVAHQWPVDGWSGAFRQGILLATGNVSPAGRQEYIATLDSYSAVIPDEIRPLIRLWREGQAAQLSLAASRSRYAALQENSDSELETLRRQQQQLATQLADTRRKLERLTDIERQLSSRKSSDVTESSHNFPPAAETTDGWPVPTATEETR